MVGWFLSTHYGSLVPDATINGEKVSYGVINEKAVRAGAGIMFALGGTAFAHAFLVQDFLWASIIIPSFLIDFVLKVFIGPKVSPISRIAELLVASQKPQWVAATPKRFAWLLGLILSTTALLLIFVFNIRGLAPLIICSTCLVFMWLETSVGYCAGCHIYAFFLNKKIIPAPKEKLSCGEGKACPIR